MKTTTRFVGTCYACGGVGHSKNRCPRELERVAAASRPATVVCHDCRAHVPNLRAHRASCPHSRLAKSRVASSIVMPTAAAPTTDHYAILDVSDSMKGARLAAAKAALLEDIVPSMSDADRLAVITFDTQAFFKLKPRAVRQLRAQRELGPLMARIFAKGNTALWDAVHMALTQVRDPHRRTRLTVLTDGEDNSSTHTHAEVLALVAARPNTVLNIVHVGDSANVQYERVCAAGRGVYRVVPEAALRLELTLAFSGGGATLSVSV